MIKTETNPSISILCRVRLMFTKNRKLFILKQLQTFTKRLQKLYHLCEVELLSRLLFQNNISVQCNDFFIVPNN